MRKKHKWVRILAIVLVVLLAGGVVVSALLSALAESVPADARDQYAITMEYLADEQALRVEQRLVYINRTGQALDRVVFCAAANMMRRESAIIYENDDLDQVFPAGYAPGGIDLRAVRVNGADTDYGFIGSDELSLRVACALAPGETAVFEFEYYLLLTECAAFIGVGETDVRLSAFYFIPGVYDPTYGEFNSGKPLPFTRWLFSDTADYEVSIMLPEGWVAASAGGMTKAGDVWRASARNVREFALSFGRRWRTHTRETASGVPITLLTRSRRAASVLETVVSAIEQCEAWFGAFPFDELVIADSDYPLGALNFPGYVQLSGALIDAGGDALEKRLRVCVAQQYFGLSAYVEPSADAWLSDSLCEYLSYLIIEVGKGRDAFLKAVNRDWVSALQLTVPGGLRVTSDAALFDAAQYDIVVRTRGAVVFYELRQAMGLETMLEALAAFYRLGQERELLTEMDLVDCLDATSGGSWYSFMTDWVFNVGDYVNQTIDWLD